MSERQRINKMLDAARSWMATGKPEDANQAQAAIGRAERLIEKHGLDRRTFRFPGDPEKPTMDDIPIYRAEDIARQARAERDRRNARPDFNFSAAAAAAAMSQEEMAAVMRRAAEAVMRAQRNRHGRPKGQRNTQDAGEYTDAGRRATRRPMSGKGFDHVIIDDPYSPEPFATDPPWMSPEQKEQFRQMRAKFFGKGKP